MMWLDRNARIHAVAYMWGIRPFAENIVSILLSVEMLEVIIVSLANQRQEAYLARLPIISFYLIWMIPFSIRLLN